MNAEVLLDSQEVARRLNVAPYTVKSWRRKGVGPAYTKIEGRVYYTQKQIDDYIASRTVTR